MEIDVHALETYNDLARDGAESAAEALSALTGVETRVETTGVSLLSGSDLRYEFADRTFAGISVSLGSPLTGEITLAFDDDGREAIASDLVPTDDPEQVEAAVAEVGNILANGFVGGWADHLETKIPVSPPTYVEGSGVDVLPHVPTDDGEYTFVFRSVVRSTADLSFRILLFPTVEALEELLGNRAGGGIPLEKLEVFTEMTERGGAVAAEKLTTMTGLETTVEVNRLNFVSIPDIPAQVGDDRRVGAAVEYEGPPGGYLTILFRPESAAESVGALLPVDGTDEWGERERGALEELCNVIASGFLDGWANVLETSIRHSPPSFVADMGSAILSPIVADIARTENYAFVLDSTIETDDSGTVQCQLLALPRRSELEGVLETLPVERAGETATDPSDHFNRNN
ncbi:chemotaxis protein CheC [Natrarchaeobius sp. A-rgal3]|uniref:chemotaxis protein CheC n=1 Tax=Natrarchaeobius versutus TaxID=1679078 RepID=UPI00350EF63F